MLAARILTALVLGPAVIAGVLFLPYWAMQAFFGVFVFVGAMEWAGLASGVSRMFRVTYAATTVIVMVAAFRWLRESAAMTDFLVAACVWWALAAAWVIVYQVRGAPRVRGRGALMLLGWVALVPGWCAVSLLLTQWPEMLIGFFAMVWSADILAYFGGRAFGRRRLAHRVSPGKTWEGLLIGLAGTLILATLAQSVLRPAPLAIVLMVVAASLLASVVGDLLESLLKRSYGVKDSGSLLPGHGGVLDRIDSTLAAAPVFALGFVGHT